MAIKALLDNLDDVPEVLQEEYTKKTVGGKEVYVLNVDGIDNHPAVRSLKTAHEAVKSKRDELKTQLEETTARFEGLPEDFNIDAFKTLKAAAEGKGGQVTAEQVEEIRKAERAKLEKEYGPIKDRNNVLTTEVRRSKIDDGLTNALVGAGVPKEYLAGARALLKENGKIELVENEGRFEAVVESGLGPQKLSEFVTEWVGTSEGKVFLGKPTGGDAMGSGGKGTDENPFKVAQGGRINLTKVSDLVSRDKEKALRLARAAGIPDGQLKQFGLAS